LTGCVLTACVAVKPPQYAQRANITVRSEETRGPVQGASIRVNGQSVGATTSEGIVEVRVSGIAGEKFHVELACPEGYKPPTPDSEDIFVTPTLNGPPPQLLFHCESATRKVVVDVRAENGPRLPVRYLGREIGVTDAHGTARVTVDSAPGDTFELVLDTTGAKTLHPQSPALSFRVGSSSSAFVFAQKFTMEKPKLKAKPKPSVPTNLNPNR
jgi:hypothetical protein